MQNLSAKPQGRQQAAAQGYEKRDADAKWIFGIVAFLIAAGLIMHFCLLGLMTLLGKTPTPRDRLYGVAHANAPGENKNVPHLQLSPPKDLREFRAREETELNTYGWIDRTNGVVRVPIDRAMELVLQRGLPTRAGTNEDRSGPSSYDLQQQRVNSETRNGGQQ
jgi:hypothetical protein